MRKILLLSLALMLIFTGCSAPQVEEVVAKESQPTQPVQLVEKVHAVQTQKVVEEIDYSVPLTLEDLEDASNWEWCEDYGYFVTANYRWDFLTVWYDPFESSYTLDHPYSSLSLEHIANNTKIYPLNRMYTNEYGNTFIPFVFSEEKYSDYENDGDGVFWLLYENYNGYTFLEHYPDNVRTRSSNTQIKHIASSPSH